MRKLLITSASLSLSALFFTSLAGCHYGDATGGGSGDTNGTGSNGPLAVSSVVLGASSCTLSTNLGAAKSFSSSAGFRDYYPGCSSNFITLQVNVTGGTVSGYTWSLSTPTNFSAGLVSTNNSSSNSSTVTIRYTLPASLTETTPAFVSVRALDTNGNFANASFQLNFMGALTATTTSQLLIAEGFRPHLSPDGTKVAFNRLSDFTGSARSEVWFVNANGSGLKQLTSSSSTSDYWPQWAPDGQRIVFLRKSGNYDTNALGTLYSINPDGTGLQQHAGYSSIKDFCFAYTTGATNIIANYNNHGLYTKSTWPRDDTTFNPILRNELTATQPRGQSEPTVSPAIVMFDPGASSLFQAMIVYLPFSGVDTPNFVSINGQFPWPCLAPRGTKIIAGSAGKGIFSSGLYIMDILGGSSAQLDARVSHQPTWSKTTVLYNSPPTGSSLEHGDIYILQVTE